MRAQKTKKTKDTLHLSVFKRVFRAGKEIKGKFPKLLAMIPQAKDRQVTPHGQEALFPNLKHVEGQTHYIIRTVTGFAKYSLDAHITVVKEEDVALSNRATKFKEKKKAKVARPVLPTKSGVMTTKDALARLKVLKSKLAAKKTKIATLKTDKKRFDVARLIKRRLYPERGEAAGSAKVQAAAQASQQACGRASGQHADKHGSPFTPYVAILTSTFPYPLRVTSYVP
jgi:hypothetical protein